MGSATRVGGTKSYCGRARKPGARGEIGEMKRKKIGKRGSVIIALLAVTLALAASPAASAASWVGSTDASWAQPDSSNASWA